MKDGYGKGFPSSFGEQVLLDVVLPYAIFPEGDSWSVLCGRNFTAVTVNPDSSAVKKMRVPVFQRSHKLLRALLSIAGQIDYRIGIKRGNLLSEVSARLFRIPVKRNVVNLRPGGVWPIRGLQPSTDAQDRMAASTSLGVK